MNDHRINYIYCGTQTLDRQVLLVTFAEKWLHGRTRYRLKYIFVKWINSFLVPYLMVFDSELFVHFL